jgi:serine protease 16
MPLLLLLALLALLAHRGARAAPFSATRAREFRGHGRPAFDVFEAAARPEGAAESLISPCPAAPPRPILGNSASWFHGAHLDNFAAVLPPAAEGAAEACTWSQRFYVNATWCAQDGCPVFLYIGGEGPLSPHAVGPRLFMHEAAERHGAMVVALEHRYFGESWPTEDMRTDYLARYLSSAQALADIARFRQWFPAHAAADASLKRYSLAGSPWVGFGGSYPGNLAAWVKVRFPHLFAGTVASSAPLTAVEEGPGYMQVVGSALKHFGGDGSSGSGSTCFASVSAAGNAIAVKLASDAGLAELSKLFKTCGDHPMSSANTSQLDLQTFASNVVGSWQGLVQYNRPAPRTSSVAHMCGELNARVDGGASPLEAFAATTLDMAEAPFVARNISTKYCTEISDSDSIAQLKNTTFDGVRSMRQWVFMTCNEFGFFQVAGKNPALDPFAALSEVLNLDMFTSMCDRAYAWQGASPATGWSNSKYGLPEDVSAENVTFPSGSLDPWHVLGVTNTSNPVGGADFQMPCACKISELDELPVFIPFTSHCQDMGRCPIGTDGAQNCSVPHIAWAHDIIHARIDGYLGKSGGGGGMAPAPSPGSGPSPSDQTGVLVATAFASLAAGVSLAFVVPKLIQCVRRRRGGGRTVWGGVQRGESHYQGFGVGMGTDI